ncbi:hypothetical protein D3C71_1408950 [compost metagenome]
MVSITAYHIPNGLIGTLLEDRISEELPAWRWGDDSQSKLVCRIKECWILWIMTRSHVIKTAFSKLHSISVLSRIRHCIADIQILLVAICAI